MLLKENENYGRWKKKRDPGELAVVVMASTGNGKTIRPTAIYIFRVKIMIPTYKIPLSFNVSHKSRGYFVLW